MTTYLRTRATTMNKTRIWYQNLRHDVCVRKKSYFGCKKLGLSLVIEPDPSIRLSTVSRSWWARVLFRTW